MFKKLTVALLVVCALAAGVAAQKPMKAWTEWSKKDAEKVLNNSGWGQTQVETDTTEMFFTPTQRGGFNDPARSQEGATNSEIHVNYFVRFFSARPVRMALARSILLDMKNPEPQVAERLKQFAEIKSTDSIIVTVWFNSTDQRAGGRVLQALSSGETSTLKQFSYLERSKDGKRLFLQEYVKPGKDGFGARYIFPRTVDGEPFITPEGGEVRFHSEVGSKQEFKIDRRFKIADMMYEGALEY